MPHPGDISPQRCQVLTHVASDVCRTNLGHPTRVAIDGVSASGKSTFARQLAETVERLGRPAIHLTMDDFHNRRVDRYRRGRMSAAGYYDDAYDFAALVSQVLLPLGPHGDGLYRTGVLDLHRDEPIEEAPRCAPADAILLVDGSFLQRPEVRDFWDVCVFVHADFPVALRRAIARDADSLGGPEATRAAYEQRYHAAGHLYVERVRPQHRATFVVDNNDLAHPVATAGPGSTVTAT